MSTYVPLSLRRKVVIALDAEQLLPPSGTAELTADETTASAQNRFSTFKTVAWAKANLLRPTEDHVFLVTTIDPKTAMVDRGVLGSMWNSMVNDQEDHGDRVVEAEGRLRQLGETLSRVGVSSSVEVLRGTGANLLVDYVHRHRGEILVLQAPVRSAWADAVAYSWADVCVRQAECPVLVVKQSDLSDNVAAALDPPLPTQDMTSAEEPEEPEEPPGIIAGV